MECSFPLSVDPLLPDQCCQAICFLSCRKCNRIWLITGVISYHSITNVTIIQNTPRSRQIAVILRRSATHLKVKIGGSRRAVFFCNLRSIVPFLHFVLYIKRQAFHPLHCAIAETIAQVIDIHVEPTSRSASPCNVRIRYQHEIILGNVPSWPGPIKFWYFVIEYPFQIRHCVQLVLCRKRTMSLRFSPRRCRA